MSENVRLRKWKKRAKESHGLARLSLSRSVGQGCFCKGEHREKKINSSSVAFGSLRSLSEHLHWHFTDVSGEVPGGRREGGAPTRPSGGLTMRRELNNCWMTSGRSSTSCPLWVTRRWSRVHHPFTWLIHGLVFRPRSFVVNGFVYKSVKGDSLIRVDWRASCHAKFTLFSQRLFFSS